MTRARLLLVAGALLLGCLLCGQPRIALAQQQSSIDTTAADDPDTVIPKRRMVKWNEYDGPVTTLRFGFGFLTDFSTQVQDDASKEQFDVNSDIGVRDFRFLLSGKFKTKRPINWTLGYMYDGVNDDWRFRQTGVTVGIPEIASKIFIGRTKEGYSMIKLMNGYTPWGEERTPSLDFVPILGDGARLMTYLKNPRVFWSIGYFSDFIGESESFATADHQVSSRLVWQPVLSDDNATVLHVGLNGRTFKPDNDVVRIKSKPENNLAPQFLDTGSIPSNSAQTYGYEIWYRKNAWLFGSEWNWETVHAEPSGDPVFSGGNAVVSWNITGETRVYNAAGAFFAPVSPKRTVFEGGPGAFEAVLNYSFADYNSGPYAGGKMWRITPMLNWHMSDNVRLEFVYGYVKVDRFGVEGGTSFFQARTQFCL